MSTHPFYTSDFALDFRYFLRGPNSEPDNDDDNFAPLLDLVTNFQDERHPLSRSAYVEFARDFLEAAGWVPQYTYPDPLFERAFSLFREHNPDPIASNAFLRDYSQQSRARLLDDSNEWLASTRDDLAAIDREQRFVDSRVEAGTITRTEGSACERQLDRRRIELLGEQRWAKDVIEYAQSAAATVEDHQYYRPDLAVRINLGGSEIPGPPPGAQASTAAAARGEHRVSPVLTESVAPVAASVAKGKTVSKRPQPLSPRASEAAELDASDAAELDASDAVELDASNAAPPAKVRKPSKRARVLSPASSDDELAGENLPPSSRTRAGPSTRASTALAANRVQSESPVHRSHGPTAGPSRVSARRGPRKFAVEGPLFIFPGSCDYCRHRQRPCNQLDEEYRCEGCAKEKKRCTYWLVNRQGLVINHERRAFAAFNGHGFTFANNLSPKERLQIEVIVEVLEGLEHHAELAHAPDRQDDLAQLLESFERSTIDAPTVYSSHKRTRDHYYVSISDVVLSAKFKLKRGHSASPDSEGFTEPESPEERNSAAHSDEEEKDELDEDEEDASAEEEKDELDEDEEDELEDPGRGPASTAVGARATVEEEEVRGDSTPARRSSSRPTEDAPVPAIDELLETPMPSGRTVTSTHGPADQFATELDNDVKAIREEYNSIAARIRRDTSQLRSLEEREESLTKMAFGEYETPHAPAPQP